MVYYCKSDISVSILWGELRKDDNMSNEIPGIQMLGWPTRSLRFYSHLLGSTIGGFKAPIVSF